MYPSGEPSASIAILIARTPTIHLYTNKDLLIIYIVNIKYIHITFIVFYYYLYRYNLLMKGLVKHF